MHTVDAFVQDLRYGVRLMRRNPGFTAAGILTVALGIGATAAVFTLVYGIVLRPLAYPQSERLVSVWTNAPRLGLPRAFAGPADYRDWSRRNEAFESAALVRQIGNFNLSGAGEPERLLGARVTASLFRVLRTPPALGRPFLETEEQVGRERVTILSDRLWTRRFARDPSIVGRSILLNGEAHQVVGVMPEGFAYPSREFELWVPLTVNPEDYVTRANLSFLSIARLKPGVGIEQAQSELTAIAQSLAQQYAANRDISFVVEPLKTGMVRDVRTPLLILFAAVCGLLLIGCASLANLLIARALARSGELVLRSALGAGRGRLVRQSLTELLPLLICGGAAGVLLARLLVELATPWLPSNMPRVESVAVGAPVLVFAAVAVTLTAVLTGLWPALQVARWDVASALRESLRGASTTLRGARARDVLVVMQVAIALVLTISAVLLSKSLVNLRRVSPGFQVARVQTMHLAIPRSKYPTDPQVAAVCGAVLDRVREIPGVEAAGMVNRLPFTGVGQINGIELASSAMDGAVAVDSRTVTPDYFRAMGIPLVEGRSFTEQDSVDSAPVGLIDERLARAAWPNQSALGRRFRIPVAGLPWITVVGVVGHIRHEGLTSDPRPQVYWNYLQRPQDRMALVIKTLGDAPAIVRPAVAAIRSIDPEQPVYDVRTMAEVLDRATGQERLTASVVGVFALFALLMSSIGVYGVMAYGVRLRAREFSIRMALGAARSDLIGVVLRRGALLVGSGLAAGVVVALVATRGLGTVLHGVGSMDAVSFAGAIAVLTLSGLLATLIPARRAVSVEPMGVLRGE